MEILISLSQAKLQREEQDAGCLRRAVLVQNALRSGVQPMPPAVVPSEACPYDGPGRLFRTSSTHDVNILDAYQARAAPPAPREHLPHFMVDVTADLTSAVSPPTSPEMDMLSESLDYGVVPTTTQTPAFHAQPLLLGTRAAASQAMAGGLIMDDDMGDVADEQVPEFPLFDNHSKKRSFAQSCSAPPSKRHHCMDAYGDVHSVDWMMQ